MTDKLSPKEHYELPKTGFYTSLSIGSKLAISFGILVLLIFLSAGVSYLGNSQASTQIDRTSSARVPAALAASKAQANLLRMQADVRGYLALGEQSYRDSYEQSAKDFEANLAELQDLSDELGALDEWRVNALVDKYQEWAGYPDRLFALRDDQLDREPAYRTLVITGTLYAGQVLIDVKTLIETQGVREPTAENLAYLEDMAGFQGNFSSMLSALRGYVTTRNRIYREEYEVNLVDNQNSWERLLSQRGQLSENQQALLDNIATNRQAFLEMPSPIFKVLESEEWRADLFIFSTEAVKKAIEMQKLLSDMVLNQQTLLAQELKIGQGALKRTAQLILVGGFIALVVGLGSWFLSRETIARPVGRLTNVADQIRGGDLEAQARVESSDEIGILASTFNRMTSQLRQTLQAVRREKKRADDLLDVVIPIGVELSTERDFNRLLENMLLEAKSFCHAEAGTLYLRTDDDQMRYVIVRNDALDMKFGGTTGNAIPFTPVPLHMPGGALNSRQVTARVTLTGNTVNIPTTTQGEEFDFINLSDKHYPIDSMLAIPLKNSAGQVLGVMQLINARSEEFTGFNENLQRMMESFSSLAVAALEAYIREQKLKQEIQQLRIEIDEVKRQKQVEEIVDTDFFRTISSKAKDLRERRRAHDKGET